MKLILTGLQTFKCAQIRTDDRVAKKKTMRGKKKRKEEKKKKMTVGPDMKRPTYSLPDNSGAGGSHNKAC